MRPQTKVDKMIDTIRTVVGITLGLVVCVGGGLLGTAINYHWWGM